MVCFIELDVIDVKSSKWIILVMFGNMVWYVLLFRSVFESVFGWFVWWFYICFYKFNFCRNEDWFGMFDLKLVFIVCKIFWFKWERFEGIRYNVWVFCWVKVENWKLSCCIKEFKYGR